MKDKFIHCARCEHTWVLRCKDKDVTDEQYTNWLEKAFKHNDEIHGETNEE